MKKKIIFRDDYDDYGKDLIVVNDNDFFIPAKKDTVMLYGVCEELNITGKVVKRRIYYDFGNDTSEITIYLEVERE